MTYIATFYSHFGALHFRKICQEAGIPAEMMPVPRTLSSSCGTCVRYESDSPCPDETESYPEETEQVVIVHEDHRYETVFRAKES